MDIVMDTRVYIFYLSSLRRVLLSYFTDEVGTPPPKAFPLVMGEAVSILKASLTPKQPILFQLCHSTA